LNTAHMKRPADKLKENTTCHSLSVEELLFGDDSYETRSLLILYIFPNKLYAVPRQCALMWSHSQGLGDDVGWPRFTAVSSSILFQVCEHLRDAGRSLPARSYLYHAMIHHAVAQKNCTSISTVFKICKKYVCLKLQFPLSIDL
jgi:hypothetical protein